MVPAFGAKEDAMPEMAKLLVRAKKLTLKKLYWLAVGNELP